MRKRTFVAETANWAKKIGGKFGLKMAYNGLKWLKIAKIWPKIA